MTQHKFPSRGFEQAMAAFNTDGIMGDWRQRTARLLRAQQRMMQGMATTAQLELRFGQECMFSQLGLLNGGWTQPGTASRQWAEEMNKLMSMIHEINEELKTSFTEAGKMLNGDGAAEVEDKPATAARRAKTAMPEEAEKTAA